MNKVVRKNKVWLTILACLICTVFAVVMTQKMTVSAAGGTGTSADYSFATMAKAAAQYFNYSMSADGTGLIATTSMDRSSSGSSSASGGSLPYDISNVGSLLGWVPLPDDNSDTVYGLGAAKNDGATSYTISAFSSKFKLSDGVDENIRGDFKAYAYYGYALGQLGLDSTAISNGETSNSLHMILGGLMLVAYLLTLGLSAFFALVFDLLNFANPLRLFIGTGSVIADVIPGLQTVDTSAGLSSIDLASSSVTDAIKAGVADLVGLLTNFYNNLYHMSWSTIIPIVLAATLFVWLVVRQGRQTASTFKNLFVRMVFATLGIPILLSLYTTALGWVDAFCISTTDVGSKVILNTFVDFENWVYSSRLGLPVDVSITVDESTLSVSLPSVRRACASINRLSGYPNAAGSFSDYVVGSTGSSNGLSGGVYEWNAWSDTVLDVKGSSTGSSFAFNGSNSSFSINTLVEGEDVSRMISLLKRYMLSDTITSAAFQSRRTADIQDSDDYSNNAYALMCNESSNFRYFDPKLVTDIVYKVDTGSVDINRSADDVRSDVEKRFINTKWSDSRLINIWNDGDSGISVSALSSSAGYVYNGVFESAGLSTMSMYNYLSTSFDSTSLSVYSTDSKATNLEHYSVNAVGGGVMSVVNIINTLVLLASLSVIGYGYGLAMMFGNFKALFKIIGPVFAGMLGSMRGIASAIILVAALIINILLTCVLYAVASDIMYAMYSLIDVPLIIMFKGFATSWLAPVISLALSVVSIIVTVTIIKKLLQWRVAIVQAVTETAASVVNKMLSTSVAAPNLNTAGATGMQKLANAAAVGTSLTMGAMATGAKTGESGSKLASLGETLGITKPDDDKNGESGDKSSDAMSESALGVKSGNGTGEATNTNTSAISGAVDLGKNRSGRHVGLSDGPDDRGVNSEEQAQAYLDHNADKIDALSGDQSEEAYEADNDANETGDADKTADSNGKRHLKKKTPHAPDARSKKHASLADTSDDGIPEKPDFDEDDTSSNLTEDQNDRNSRESGKSDEAGGVGKPGRNTGKESSDETYENKGTFTERLHLDKNTETNITDGGSDDASADDASRTGNRFSNMNARPDSSGNGNKWSKMIDDARAEASDTASGDSVTASSGAQTARKNGASKFVDTGSAASDVQSASANTAGKYIVGGNSGEQYQVICDATGKPYTAADQASGKTYSVVGSSGKPFVDSSGTSYAGVMAGTVQFGSGGKVQSMVNPANGMTTSFAPAPASASGSHSSAPAFSGGGGGGTINVTPVIMPNATPSAPAPTAMSATPAFMSGGGNGGSVMSASGGNTTVHSQNINTVQSGGSGSSGAAAFVASGSQPAQAPAAAPAQTATPAFAQSGTQSTVFVQGSQSAPVAGGTAASGPNVTVQAPNGGTASIPVSGVATTSTAETVINQQINNGGATGGNPVYVNAPGGASEGPSIQTVEVAVPYADSDASQPSIPVAPAAAPVSAPAQTAPASSGSDTHVVVEKSDSNKNSSDGNNSSDNDDNSGESGIMHAINGIASAVAGAVKNGKDNKK